ncbi:copper chaperone PCu(A)C [Kineococcus sp. TBRC 1896]|uniref:Copper chaperone PCu(A)C n=1 Tax=Kineococcus mangrovi TaxID=1660183 RepID=A0ABV4I3F2_9ACTN
MTTTSQATTSQGTTPTAVPATVALPARAGRSGRGAGQSRRRLALAAAPLLAVVGLAACSGGARSTDGVAAPAATTSTAPSAGSTGGGEASAVTITDPWVKAADTGMTAAFATLSNTGAEDVHIVSATTASSTSTELHEMATDASGAMVMRPKEGGFVVPAGGTHELSPGGDHLMLMSVTAPVLPGQDVTITLTAEDGSTVDLTAPARSYSGANESYDGDGDGEADGTGTVEGGHGTEGMEHSGAPTTATATP